MKRLTILCLFLVIISGLWAQSIDNSFELPLDQVLTEVERRFQVHLEYDSEWVDTLEVRFARWRFQSELETTLYNVLGPLDLVFSKKSDSVYVVLPFRYYVRSVEEGKKHLERLAGLSPDLESWNARKENLRTCLFEALSLDPLPQKNELNPIYTTAEMMDGYSVEDVALETLPGVYISGSLYKPAQLKGKSPAILLAQGHGDMQHYHESSQKLAASLARMGAVVFSYDMFAKGESGLQFPYGAHRTGLAQSMQTWNSIRVLDFLCSLPDVDSQRVGMTGASGGGTQTFLLTALDDRVAASAPVVMVSSWFFGGCPCESGMPIHACGRWGTNNAEIAAMAAPRPMLVVSDGGDWTAHVPEIEFPFIQDRYSLYGKPALVQNVHFPDEKHDYGPSKRKAVYGFFADVFTLDLNSVLDAEGKVTEELVTVQPLEKMLVFGRNGESLPQNAIHGIDELKKLLEQ
ncbi:alpha/beta hydrolase family protein [Mangrovibacterium lignilyticum]|uniref:alpha/beta hydrolase family protein n=1 Tax=Mangrovibacterium lignilyticum TaxID=2668052 RepID=UPI0013D87C30|nr:acetylxylan esterase [Mangrovibacterium lignilyticum]